MAERPDARRAPQAASASGTGPADEAAAARRLAQLDAQANAVRAELARLRQDLARTEQVVAGRHAAQLLEANEHLVLAAMRADAIAGQAVRKLRELTHDSQHDALTGCPNRVLLLDRLQNAMAMAERHRTRLAVLFIDIDDFKRTNDTLGHEAGDEVLRSVAQRLQSVVRASDTVSRYGGDEFVVLLPELAQASDAALMVADIRAALGEACRAGGQVVHPSASIGIAFYPDDGKGAATLIRRADAAMYRAKRLGPGRFAFHADRPNMGELAPAPAPAPGEASLRPAQRSSTTRGNHEGHLRNLQEANEHLVLAALTAQDLEAAAESARRRQIRYLAMITHELRNPLAPIRSAAELLARAGSDERMLARVQGVIHRQVTHMARLLDDLLDSSQASIGGFRIERSSVAMDGVLMLAVDTCRPAIEGRQQRLKLDLPSTPVQIDGDPIRLAQMFINLLDNASKYTSEGGEIGMAAEVRAQSLVVTVSDNGIGLAPDALSVIFDLFRRDPKAIAHGGGGQGVGLAVVRELAQAHGGNVVARSAGEGLGSEFVVTLPIPGDAPRS